MSDWVFRHRRDAGRVLAGLLDHYRGPPDVLALGLPRGGVPVAYEMAMATGGPVDAFLVRNCWGASRRTARGGHRPTSPAGRSSSPTTASRRARARAPRSRRSASTGSLTR